MCCYRPYGSRGEVHTGQSAGPLPEFLAVGFIESIESIVPCTEYDLVTFYQRFCFDVTFDTGISPYYFTIFDTNGAKSGITATYVSDTPKEIWASNVGFGYEHAPSMQMEKDDIVFSSTKEGLIFALDASTGQVLWKHKIGNSLINTVLPISRHQVLFTATSGETSLLEWKE